jgi:hypothetical protein
MMQSSGEFRRYADEQAAENTVVQRRVQNALRDAAARIDALEKRCLELDAACCDYQRQRDEVQDERRHAVSALSEQVDTVRAERDRARRLVCELQCDPPERFVGVPNDVAQMYGWDCFMERMVTK